MFERLAKTYLKWTGKQHLIPFLDGLLNIGRPGTVFFPMELIEQGVGLVLSGLNNTLATQSHPDWVWPWWLERQQDPATREFIPTGVNLLTANLSLRNWVSFGLASSSRESMLDPVGMLTLHPFGWSVFPYVKSSRETWLLPRFPERALQTLEGDTMPLVRTTYRVSNAYNWYSETLALECDDEELVQFTHYLENTSDFPLNLVFGIAIRPYNMLALGHINKLKFKNRLWRVNRKPGLLLIDEPDRVAVADRHLGDPLLLDLTRVSQRNGVSRSGILSGVSEFDVSLEPGEKRSFDSLGILTRGDVRKRKFRHLTPERIGKAREDMLARHENRARSGMTVSLPEPKLETAFIAIKKHMHVFDDQDHFSPGTFFYHNSWIRDSAFIALAHENLGFGDRVAPKMQNYLKMQGFDGFFRSQNGEWDSAGQALFTMIDHVRRNGSITDLERYWGPWRKGARWIEDQCRRTMKQQAPHAGLLPAGFSAEHFGPNDHYFWDNFWALAGLQSLRWVADKLGRKDERLETFWEEYRYRVKEVITVTMQKSETGALSSSPYRMPDSASIGNLVAISPLNLFGPDEPWVEPTVNYLMTNNLLEGVFFQKIIHTGLNAYLSVQLARVLLALNDPRWRQILDALLAMGAPTYTWPEAIHPGTMGGCMGDGDHGWAAAEVVNLIRDALVRETLEGLELASGADWEKITVDRPLRCENAPTEHGAVTYSMSLTDGNLELSWSVRRSPLQDPVPLDVRIPPEWRLVDDRADRTGDRIRLPRQDSGSIQLRRVNVSQEEIAR
ncbi:MAG: hypothetical protein QNK37_07585 [Acidobacteriota bacterium]|nr:hypothetical protein [Acidobacteriota bacterium]